MGNESIEIFTKRELTYKLIDLLINNGVKQREIAQYVGSFDTIVHNYATRKKRIADYVVNYWYIKLYEMALEKLDKRMVDNELNKTLIELCTGIKKYKL